MSSSPVNVNHCYPYAYAPQHIKQRLQCHQYRNPRQPMRKKFNKETKRDEMKRVVSFRKPSMLTVGSRVSVNGLKSGTLRYLGTVQFATGEFCGVELDQPEGKHDGEVQKIR